MKVRLICIVTLFILYLAVLTMGQVSIIMNGSFEQDGVVISNINTQSPLHWCDVNMPANKFGGEVSDTFSVYGQYALTVYSKTGDVLEGDITTVSQQVFLESDVEKISFDLYLTSDLSYFPWDHTKRTVLLKIDANTIWDSNNLPIDGDGEYIGQIEIDSNSFQTQLDDDWHNLTLAMRINKSEKAYSRYSASWDFIRFDKHCGGFGYLAGDVSQDCFVDFADFALLANTWLGPIPAAKYDLYEDGVVNEIDLMVLAEDWLGNTDSNNYGQEGNYEMLLIEEDIDLSGQVDLADVVLLSDDWLSQDKCSKAEIEKDGIVNFVDFARIAEKWQQRDWIYYSD